MLIAGPKAGEASSNWRLLWFGYVLVAALLFAPVVQAQVQAEPKRYEFNIEEATLEQALEAFVQLTDAQLIYPQELAQETGVNPVVGRYTVEEALDVLLEGSGFSGGLTKGGMIVISLTKANGQDREENMASGKLKKSLLTTVSAFLFGASTAGNAQEDADPQAGGDIAEQQSSAEKQWDQIIITATRRELSLFEIPSALTVFDEGFIEDRSIDSINDLATLTPSLTVGAPQIFGRANGFTIRGVQSISGGATVGVYLDDVPQTFSGGGNEPNIRTFDLERVEVLRGPQGTLFGAGAMGGAIRYITNKPNSTEYEAKIHFEGSTTKEGGESYAVDGAVNLPIVKDKLALRVTASRQETAGVVDILNAIGGPFEDADTYELTSVRGVLRWTPTDALTVDLQVWHDETNFKGLRAVNTGSSSPFVDDIERGPLSFGDTNFDQYAGTVTYDAGFMEVVSTTSWVESQSRAETTAGPPFIFGSLVFATTFEAFSHETRFVSQHDGPFSWIVGIYYQDAKSPLDLLSSPAFGLNFEASESHEQISGFGELSYQLTDKLSATVGIRYYSEDVVERSTSDFMGIVSTSNGDASYNETLPKFLVQYEASDTLNLYASASKGFRVGGANLITSPLDPPQFDPDSLWAYEGGAKFILLDGRINGGVAVFYNDWTNIQVLTPAPSGFTNLVSNVGAAHILGFEAELSVELTEGLTLGANGAILDAEFDEDLVTFRGPIAAGDRIPSTPESSFALFLDYQRTIADNVDFRLHIDGGYNGNEVSLSQDPAVDSSMLWNGRASVSYRNVEVGLFVRNAFNDATIRQLNALLFSAPRPRTIGIDLTARL